MSAGIRLGVLASGSGTNLQSIVDSIEAGALAARVEVVIVNRPRAGALERARRHRLAAELIDHKSFPSRERFDEAVIDALRAHAVELVCLAGFDRLIGPAFVRSFPGRVLNIHPALLPAFPGLHAQRQALEYGVRITGCTVHFVDERTDHGPIVIQAAVPVHDGDTEEALRERILAEEHRIYPEAIRLFAEGRLRIDGRRVHIADPPAATPAAIENPPARQRTSS